MRKVRKVHFKTKKSFLTIIKIFKQKRKLLLKKKNWRYPAMNKIKALDNIIRGGQKNKISLNIQIKSVKSISLRVLPKLSCKKVKIKKVQMETA
jgi:hypothetical protein